MHIILYIYICIFFVFKGLKFHLGSYQFLACHNLSKKLKKSKKKTLIEKQNDSTKNQANHNIMYIHSITILSFKYKLYLKLNHTQQDFTN